MASRGGFGANFNKELLHSQTWSEEKSAKYKAKGKERNSILSSARQKLELNIHNILVEDVGDWINRTLELDPPLSQKDFWDRLQDGRILCQLVTRICEEPLPKLKSRNMCSKNLMFVRENVGKFLKICEPHVVDSIVLFEPDDLITRKNEKQVITCLLRLSKNFFRAGKLKMEDLPEVAQAELEIEIEEEELAKSPSLTETIDETSCKEVFHDEDTEELGSLEEKEENSDDDDFDERQRTPPKRKKRKSFYFVPQKGNKMEEKLANFVNNAGVTNRIPVKRVKPGKYKFGDHEKTMYVRELRNVLMVRVGGGWMELGAWMCKHMPDLRDDVTKFRELEKDRPNGMLMREVKKEKLVKKQIKKEKIRRMESDRTFHKSKLEKKHTHRKQASKDIATNQFKKTASDGALVEKKPKHTKKLPYSKSHADLKTKKHRHDEHKNHGDPGKLQKSKYGYKSKTTKAHTLRSEPMPAKKKNREIKRATSSRGFRLGSKKNSHKKLNRSRTADIPKIDSVRGRSKSPNPPSEARLRMLERANKRINSLHPKKKHTRARSRELRSRTPEPGSEKHLKRHKSYEVRNKSRSPDPEKVKKDPTSSPHSKGVARRSSLKFRLGSRKFSEDLQRRKSSIAGTPGTPKKILLIRGISNDMSETTIMDLSSQEFESISNHYSHSRENSMSPER